MINDYTKEIMSLNSDNWDRLLKATLLRQEFRCLSRLDSLSSPSSSNFSFSSFSSTGSSRSFLPSDPRISSFSRHEIELATNHFNDRNLIKRGHSGDLFLGSHEFPEDVIVKRISSLDRKAPLSFELDFFSKINNCDIYHPRFVQLLGHCLDAHDKFLVYRYLPKRDLSKALFPEGGGLRSLDWITRWKIARGVAEALSYLHHECKPPLVHGDVKASSILLDHSLEVRLGSLSKVFRRKDKYTFPWRTSTTALERRDRPKKSVCAYDVYCFGKVLLELVTGKLGISSCSDKDAEVVLETTLSYINVHRMEPIKNIVDPSLVIDEKLLEEVWAVAIIARACLNLNTKRRPIIKHVLKALENPAKLISLINKSVTRLF